MSRFKIVKRDGKTILMIDGKEIPKTAEKLDVSTIYKSGNTWLPYIDKDGKIHHGKP